jgi:hypothetical protein
MVIRRISPMSAAKVAGLVYALIGLVIGACFSVFMLTIGSLFADEPRPEGAFFGMLFGAGAIVIAPVFYGVMGFVGGGLTAFVYNMVAGWAGGLEVDLQ